MHLINLIQQYFLFSLFCERNLYFSVFEFFITDEFSFLKVFGRMVGNQRQGWAIFAVMGILFLGGVTTAYWAEAPGNPTFAALGVDQAPSALQAGGNMEGKEVRFGIANSALFATVTTDASCGAVNTMHDSMMPLGGMVPMLNIMLGEQTGDLSRRGFGIW